MNIFKVARPQKEQRTFFLIQRVIIESICVNYDYIIFKKYQKNILYRKEIYEFLFTSLKFHELYMCGDVTLFLY
jgi:hypothetical protein